MPDDTAVRYSRGGRVGVVELGRPPANAFDADVIATLHHVVDRVEGDRETRVLLFTSSLPVFSLGADLKMIERIGLEDIGTFAASLQRLFGRIEELCIPTIAAIGGHALGGGLELALACDFRLVADDPRLQLGLPEVRLGLLPAAGGTQRLTRLLGRTRATQLLLTGRRITAKEALASGLVTEVLPAEGLLARAMELAGDLAELPADALAEVKACILTAMSPGMAGGLERELQGLVLLAGSGDAAEGVRAFATGREPAFAATRTR